MSSGRRRAIPFIALIVAAGAAWFAQGRGGLAPSGPEAPARPRAGAAAPAGHVTSPKEAWGHNIGDDYFLANYQQLLAYWRMLEKESARVHLVEIGKTAEN